jgi:hypothetical protein
LSVLPTWGQYYRRGLQQCKKSMNREIKPTKHYKIMSKSSRMDIKMIPWIIPPRNNNIVRSIDGDFEWNTLSFSRANRRTPGEDRMFRRMENPMVWLDWSFHGWFWRSPQGFEREEGREVPTVGNKNPGRDSGSGGIYTPAMFIGSTDMGSVLPRVQGNYASESVLPTEGRFYRGSQR